MEGAIPSSTQLLSPDLEAAATREERQVGGNAANGPSKVVLSLDVGQTSHASIPESRMFLWRCGGEVALVKGEFLVDLEEFECLPLRKQRKMLAKNLSRLECI